MNYNIINSGSDGNATVVNEIILIDCGVSFKKLKNVYSKLKVVLLTHRHGDHFNKKTISKLASERPTLRFACCEWLLDSLIDCGVSKSNIDTLEIGKLYDYGLFKISPFKLYHDVPNCGWRVYMNDKKLMYATDTYTLDGISAKDYDVYLVEGNYINEEELHERAYTPEYESRVKATHLSKEYTAKWLLENMSDNSIYEFMHQHKERVKEMSLKEDEIKCYKFKTEVLATINGYVYARDEEEAKELIQAENWEEIEDTKIEEVENLVDIHEEED